MGSPCLFTRQQALKMGYFYWLRVKSLNHLHTELNLGYLKGTKFCLESKASFIDISSIASFKPFLIAWARLFKARLRKPRVSENFDFSFVTFSGVRCSVYIVCSSVLNCSNLKLHQILEVKNILKYQNLMLQLKFNPGLTLTGFRTTRP